MHSLKAIIFDVDGTLANTEETHRLSFNRAFAEFGLGCSWSELEYAGLLSISGGRERIFAYLKTQEMDIQGDINLRELALHIHQRKSEIYREKLVAGHIRLRSGVNRLLTEARQKNIKLGIATATSRANVETLLQQNLGTDAMTWFDAVVTADIVKDKKPSPVVYQCALAELGLAPASCIAVEDTSNGNRSARAAGLKTLITTHAFTINNDFSGASLVVDQLGEPGMPFRQIAGNAAGAGYVDVTLLERLLIGQEHESADLWPGAVAVIAK